MGNLAKGSPLIKKLIFFCFLLDTSRKSPRGYRERKPADISVEARKRATARVQGKKTREYTRGSEEKSNRAGTGKENPRINPWKRGKEQPRGYMERKPADIPVNMRRLSPRELYTLFRLRYGSIRVSQKTPRHKTFSGCLHTPVLNPLEADFSIRCACNQARACRLKDYAGKMSLVDFFH